MDDLAPTAGEGSTGSGSVQPNVALVNAPALWDLGFRGEGVVVASMDTGVDASHPDLAAQYRGGAGGGSIHTANTRPRPTSAVTGR